MADAYVAVYLALGSNMGDPDANLDSALEKLAATPGIRFNKESRRLATKPVGGPSGQNDYLNSVCRIATNLPPPALLQTVHAIEKQLGRRRGQGEIRWGPRTLDIVILLYGDSQLATDELQIPHPHLQERRFVLEPLAELAPDLVPPGMNRSVRQLLEGLSTTHERI